MNDQKLKNLIDAAIVVDRQINALDEKLKGLKKQIAAEAQTREELAIATEGGGTSTMLEGGIGFARVTETARSLKSEVSPEAKDFSKIKEAAGDVFARLFVPEIVHKLVPNFRDQAAELLGEPAAKKLIKLCENKGQTKVAFETKEAAKA